MRPVKHLSSVAIMLSSFNVQALVSSLPSVKTWVNIDSEVLLSHLELLNTFSCVKMFSKSGQFVLNK